MKDHNAIIEKDFEHDMLKDLSTTEAVFLKNYITNGGNGTKAIQQMNPGVKSSTARWQANYWLRKLRKREDFWDFLGLGYNDLAEVVATLKKERPDKACDIIMKVNREDSEKIEVNSHIRIAFEKDLDE